MHYAIALALLTTVLTACGGKKSDSSRAPEDAAAAGPTVAPIATPAIGVDAVKRMNFVYGDGMKDYDRVLAAYRAKPRDWDAVRASAEAALAKDPFHLDAHRVLASALAHAGEHAAAVDHLVTALAGDYFKYGPSLATDEDLAEFLATPHGTSVTEVAAKIRAAYLRRIPGALLVIARRSAFRWPSKDGVQPVTSRGELYAFDRETHRYLRLTHTEHQVAAVVRAPSGAELAVLGFDKLEKPKAADAPPTIARAWVQVLDTKEWQPVAPRVTFAGGREVALGYDGDTLLVATFPAAGRWGVGAPTVHAFARDTAKDGKVKGKLTKTDAALPASRVVFSLEEPRTVRAPDGVTATWAGDPPTAPTLAVAGGPTINVPESGAAAQASVALAPDQAHLAFATAVDPCAQDTAPSLYVADTKTGALDHVITAPSRFATRWLDATTLAYDDGDGAIRLYDATTGREALRLANKPGIVLDALAIGPPVCKGTPPPAEPAAPGAGSGAPVVDDEPPLPPEEPADDTGPVTKP